MRGLRFAVVIGVCTVSRSTARASILYTSTSNGAAGTDTLRQLDQTTGQSTTIGLIGLTSARDMASDTRPQSPRLWATSTDSGGDLYRVDPATGGSTLVGHMNTPTNIRTLAFDVITGRMFGTTYGHELYQIDPDTAAVALIGTVTNIGGNDFDSLAFDQQGMLWTTTASGGNSLLYTINPSTAVATFKVTTNHSFFFSDIAFRPEDNVLFGIDNATGHLFTIDIATGAATTLPAPTNPGTGLAFGVPEPGSAAFVGICLSVSLLRGRCYDHRH
jgi:streptogramin lyase